MISRFGIIALFIRKSKQIVLYSDYTGIKPQALKLAVVTFHLHWSTKLFTVNWQIIPYSLNISRGRGFSLLLQFWGLLAKLLF